MTDADFVRAFERGEIANTEFHHASHLRLALAYLTECGSVDHAIARMATALRRCAGTAGQSDQYHHTLTVFWIRMVARLLDKDLVLTYYSMERLSSDAARLAWVEPDLQPIEDDTAHATPPHTARSGDPSSHASHRPLSRPPP